ncbi:MAG: hypothetical protein DBX59_08575 [Bacillota bacterium]|nr:MAG: hypothetical protein DBX59_08575 [Bacillota bacterium]
MNKQDFTNCYARYGISPEDVCKNRLKIGGDEVERFAVISPINAAEDYKNVGAAVTQLSDGFFPTYKIEKDGAAFTFVAFQVGACNVTEVICALAYSRCEKVLFTGTVGALKEEMNIGDLLLPNYSMCGDGAVRYFTLGSAAQNGDTFGKKFYPDQKVHGDLARYLKDNGYPFDYANIFSIDTIVSQFFHIEEFLSYGADALEMETAAAFCSSEILGLKTAALFHVSDSTARNKSLLGGRSDEEKAAHGHKKRLVIPEIVCGFAKSVLSGK